MSDKAELVAAAQVNAFGPTPAGISFTANFGFETVSRTAAGVYVLELEHDHDPHKLVVNVTANNTTNGDISATLPSKKHIEVDFRGDGTDSPFFITVWRVRD